MRNGAATIADCARTVCGQSVRAQHIVIDGASSDRTVDIVKEVAPDVKCISEPDRGMYDAMNKGLLHADGEIIGFLNADDMYHDEEVLKAIQDAVVHQGVETCYGDLAYISGNHRERIVRYWRGQPFNAGAFYWGWMPPHPAFFVRREVYQRFGGFRLDMGTAADYELMLRFLVRHGISSTYVPGVLVKMRTGGVSNRSFRNRLEAHRMDQRAWEVNGLSPKFWTLPLKPLRKVGQYIARP